MNQPTLPERIERIVRAWDQWSPTERRGMDAVVWDVISHMSEGTGNAFIREWCERVLKPRLEYHDSGEGPWYSRREAVAFARAEVGVPYIVLRDADGWRVYVKGEG